MYIFICGNKFLYGAKRDVQAKNDRHDLERSKVIRQKVVSLIKEIVRKNDEDNEALVMRISNFLFQC